MTTYSEENYLKAIYHLQQRLKNGVSTNALAKKMETKASSVTDMVKKLAEKGLVEYRKYQGVKLSKKGSDTAVNIIRKHRLWEVFLVDKLEFTWDEVHDIAEQLEHIQSKKLTRQLDKFLLYPKWDPHGDPIPNEKGIFTAKHKLLLSELEIGNTAIFVGVKDSSKAFLQYLDKNKIGLGNKIHILEKEPFDNSVQIKMNGKVMTLSSTITHNLFIKIDEND